MDRLGFFKHGLTAAADVVGSMIGLKKAVNTFTEVVDEALSNIKSDMGLNLLSLQGDMYENVANTLADVARMGYTMIETASFAGGRVYDMKPEAFKAVADKAGLKIAGAHITKFLEEFAEAEAPTAEEAAAPARVDEAEKAKTTESTATAESEDPAMKWWCDALDIHRSMGCRYITMARLPENPTAATLAAYADYFDRIGERAAERGMKFCFHPDKEHLRAEHDGVSVFDAIAAATDPTKVWFEIDTYEATEAEVSIAALLKRYRKRVLLLHARDYGVVGQSGRIDFDKVVTQAVNSGVQDIFVEVRSYTLPPKNCVERSIYNLESLPAIRY